MKKTLQVERDIIVEANEIKTVNLRLKEDYKNCVGFFLTPTIAGTDFSALLVGLSIAQIEILPQGCDASLFAMTSYIGRNDATYDFTSDGIPAKSSEVQLTISNRSNNSQKVNAYFVLSNM